jgi:short-subunit dehydrogenase
MGAAFAAEALGRGVSVVLVDIDQAALDARAAEHGDRVRTLRLDLSAPTAVDDLLAATADLDVGLWVHNAGLSMIGRFVEQDEAALLRQLQVNVTVPLVAVRRALPALLARRRGGVVLLGSMSATRGTALVASYAATKAWNVILAESLWGELAGTGVTALAVLPGTTRTPGWVGSMPQAGLSTSHVMEPADVAREAFDVLGAQPSLIPSQENRDSEAFMAGLDRAQAVTIMADVMRATYPDERSPDPTV